VQLALRLEKLAEIEALASTAQFTRNEEADLLNLVA
jgi:hypothetical protein